ncbi:MAG: TIGR03618 family F420-dependent PPOX class oxidoreductase [Chloroflexota bacterium]|nr:TIGR03618 family F420-dependent PPOX class oxidoreductase [Chloroflexota bacterium]
MPSIDQQTDLFLQQTRVAVLGTINNGGSPLLSPMWFTWENNVVTMITRRSSIKWRNLRTRPFASLCVDDRNAPYAAVILSGSITEIRAPIYEFIESMARRYLGETNGLEFAEPYKNNSDSSVVFQLTPEQIVINLNR